MLGGGGGVGVYKATEVLGGECTKVQILYGGGLNKGTDIVGGSVYKITEIVGGGGTDIADHR